MSWDLDLHRLFAKSQYLLMNFNQRVIGNSKKKLLEKTIQRWINGERVKQWWKDMIFYYLLLSVLQTNIVKQRHMFLTVALHVSNGIGKIKLPKAKSPSPWGQMFSQNHCNLRAKPAMDPWSNDPWSNSYLPSSPWKKKGVNCFLHIDMGSTTPNKKF